MTNHPSVKQSQEIWQEMLGYLNFSSGAADPRFLRNLNRLMEQIESSGANPDESPRILHRQLEEKLTELTGRSAPFADPEQARAALRLTFDVVLPAYREHHHDLLFHLSDGELLRPFFIGRVFEAVLAEGARWDEVERIRDGALLRLNDFVGHRPIAVLNSSQKIEPYAHERVRPIPLYVAGADVAVGRYQQLVALALDLLRSTDRTILDSAWFDTELLDELAVDPRAYDFNHPVNKRPNYHFGQWDPHLLDRQGRFRRFVLQQVTLDALLDRVEASGSVPREELLFEAATVLAGIILMASGASGSSPQTHDSSVTLANLLPQIAAYRDAFYRQLFNRLTGSQAERLQMEAAALHQPFAAARQHLNAQLARRRALQMQHVHLAQLFARLGFPEAALRQVQIVPAVSARIVCQIQCLVTAAHRAAERGQLVDGQACIVQIEDLLERGIHCGAIVDPWSILGFGGQYSLFPAVENSIPDPRVDELIEMMERIFNAQARLWHQAAASHDRQVLAELPDRFLKLAEWWDQFASDAVSGLRWVSGRAAHAAAEKVAGALSAWHEAGANGGDLNFWRPYIDQFDSPQAYAWVIESLLEKHDLAAALALLIHWVSQADDVRLEEGPHSFHQLATRWMQMALSDLRGVAGVGPAAAAAGTDSRKLIQRYFDFIEANAESFWEVPGLESAAGSRRNSNSADDFGDLPVLESPDEDSPDFDPDEDRPRDNVYRAAYDEMVYRDSTADGVEGSMMEGGNPASDYQLEAESHRLMRRLAFLSTLARLWKQVAVAQMTQSINRPAICDAIIAWRDRAEHNRGRLGQLAVDVAGQAVAGPSASSESLVEYDRRTNIKESLLERIIATWVTMDEARHFMAAACSRRCGSTSSGMQANAIAPVSAAAPSESSAVDATDQLWQAVLNGDVEMARRAWHPFLAVVRQQPLLYVRLARGGDPSKIAAVRGLQQMFRELLRRLPRLGLLRETCQLIQTARAMERDHPLGAGAVTEFDRLFEIGFKAIIETVVDSSRHWTTKPDVRTVAQAGDEESTESDLIDCLQHVTESLLPQWGSHSHTLRLSVLEKIAAEKDWAELVAFVERYGHDLFTQSFFNLGNLRAILHEGVDAWLDQLVADPDAADNLLVIAELDGRLPRAQARKHLSLVIEAIVENYPEYRDYNATTTQSDRGELLYSLLDFLRCKAVYDRIHWNLRPVTMVHEVLIREGHEAAAAMWRRAMARETSATADQQLKRLAELQKKYGMRLSTVADRLGEHFIRPLAIDRVRALVRPSAEEARRDLPSKAFPALEAEASELAQEPTGAGLDLPDWLAVLEEEIERACGGQLDDPTGDLLDQTPRAQLTWEQIQDQLSNWEIRRLEAK